jgi:4-amino-4-deoxy-L-arabinose transferase-like glycosyltransferase
MNNKVINTLLLLIVGLAAVLRLFNLGTNPPSLNWDEAAWGYNAYTIGIDGKDEFGTFLPYEYLESYGDFKPPLYAYLAVIPVKLFGVTEFAIRFPSAVFGVLTVLATFYLVKEIFYSKKRDNKIELIALTSALILAVSPWHIMLSRAAFEANVATFFIVVGIVFFLYAIRKNMWMLVVSALSFALTFYIFNTPRIVVPLLVLTLVIASWRILWKHKLQTIIAGLVGAVIVLPLVPFLLSPQASLRFQEVNIFSDIKIVEEANKKIEEDNNAWWSKIINNRRVGYSREFALNYLDHFNPTFLFISGDVNPRFSTQDVGQMYIWDILFIGVGSLLLLKNRNGKWWIIPVWIAIGIIPAATARETPHALRIETVLPTFQILVAYGFIHTVFFLKRKKLATFILLSILGINVWYFLYGYTQKYPEKYSGEWQYGYKQVAEYIRSDIPKYENVYITSEIGRPYIYFLLQYTVHPEDFRKNSVITRDAFGFVTVEQYKNMHFMKELPHTIEGENLFVNIPSQVPQNAQIQKTITQLNGQEVFVVYTLQNDEKSQ